MFAAIAWGSGKPPAELSALVLQLVDSGLENAKEGNVNVMLSGKQFKDGKGRILKWYIRIMEDEGYKRVIVAPDDSCHETRNEPPCSFKMTDVIGNGHPRFKRLVHCHYVSETKDVYRISGKSKPAFLVYYYIEGSGGIDSFVSLSYQADTQPVDYMKCR